MIKKLFITNKVLTKLNEELKKLETLDRQKISKNIAEARDKGYLSENAEYDYAKEAQGVMEMLIYRLKKSLLMYGL